MRNKDILEKVLEAGSFLSFGGLLTVVTIQIVTRNLFPFIIVEWTEETCRFLFIYSIMFAAPLAMKKQEFVNVDILLNYLPKGARKIGDLILQLVSIGLFILVAIHGITFAKISIGETSPVLRMPMVYLYSSIVIMTILIAVYGMYNIIRSICGTQKEGEVS